MPELVFNWFYLYYVCSVGGLETVCSQNMYDSQSTLDLTMHEHDDPTRSSTWAVLGGGTSGRKGLKDAVGVPGEGKVLLMSNPHGREGGSAIQALNFAWFGMR